MGLRVPAGAVLIKERRFKNMDEGRYKPLTFKAVKERQRSLEELLTLAHMDGFVPDDEFARDMQLLVQGEMSPQQHREYLKKKYQSAETLVEEPAE